MSDNPGTALVPIGTTGLQKAQSAAADFIAASQAANTRRAYAADWRDFQAERPGAAFELDLAAYNLEQTHLLAPIAGHVNNMWLRIGDYANPGVPRVGLVADDSWSVIALYREEAIRHLQDGLKVWIYLDLYPYQLFRGTIQGVARGIARGDRQTAILPEIELALADRDVEVVQHHGRAVTGGELADFEDRRGQVQRRLGPRYSMRSTGNESSMSVVRQLRSIGCADSAHASARFIRFCTSSGISSSR